jgi:hypothetical protein
MRLAAAASFPGIRLRFCFSGMLAACMCERPSLLPLLLLLLSATGSAAEVAAGVDEATPATLSLLLAAPAKLILLSARLLLRGTASSATLLPGEWYWLPELLLLLPDSTLSPVMC